MTPQASVTREVLYEQVWSEPMTKVAARYGVSSSYLARICSRLAVPRPERGYWAKLEVGKAPPKTALPDPGPSDQLVWLRGEDAAAPQPRRVRLAPLRRGRAPLGPAVPEAHPLIRGAKALFEEGRLSYELEYLKPLKYLLVDLRVSKATVDSALSFAAELFQALESRGHRVAIASAAEQLHKSKIDVGEKPGRVKYQDYLWSPMRCTVTYVRDIAIGLTVYELAEEALARYVKGNYVRESEYVAPKNSRFAVDHTWTTTKYWPTGRLALHAYSPYDRTDWAQRWTESKAGELRLRIPAIVRALENACPQIACLAEEGEREGERWRQQCEAERARWQEEERARKAAEARKRSHDELCTVIEEWAEARRIQEFFTEVEARAVTVPEERRIELLERLRKARELIDTTDALKHLLDWKAPDER